MPIHRTALVSRAARIASDVEIGAFVVVEDDVEIGEGTRIASHAVLKSGLRLGSGITVHEGAVLGGPPQDMKFENVVSFAVVGDGSVIREFATIHRSVHENGTTRVGRGCFIMSYGHVAHDCDIGDGAIIASYAALAGHIHIGQNAFISGGVAIHQFTRIGELAMVGGGSKVNLDVPPFMTVDGVPARAVGLNSVGLRRDGVPDEDVRALKLAYRMLYREKRPLRDALELLEGLQNDRVATLVEFIRGSERGVCRVRAR
jgi:UDP-N-acetylglucosamine acyltransferase